MATKPLRDDPETVPNPVPPPTPARPADPKEVPAGGGSDPDPDYVDDPTAHLRAIPADAGTPATPGQGLPPEGE